MPAPPCHPVTMRSRTNDRCPQYNVAPSERNQPSSLLDGYASMVTYSSERRPFEDLGYPANDSDLNENRHPPTSSTQLSYHDAGTWQHIRMLDQSNEGNDDSTFRSSHPSLSHSRFLNNAANHDTEAHSFFQDEPRRYPTPKDEWLGLRQSLSTDEYSDGFVEDIHLLLENLSYCSSIDEPPNDSKHEDLLYLHGGWHCLSEWRALPFEGSLLPSDFLHVDEHLVTFRTCLEGCKAHDDQVCLCAAPEDNLKNLWVTPSGLSPNAKIMRLKEEITREDTEAYDHFGNRLLHFLAARGSPQVLFEALKVAADISSLNFGGQTFLHCLGPDWFIDELSPLHVLLEQLAQKNFDFSQRDTYGQSILHIWARRLDNWEILLPLWSHGTISNCIRQRDAFGYQPSNIRTDEGGLYLPVPSLQKPERSSFEIVCESAFLIPYPDIDIHPSLTLVRNSVSTRLG